jgi:hypothetical protein
MCRIVSLSEILRLTKGWKIGIIGLIIALIGFSPWSFNIFLKLWFNGNNFIFVTIWFVGMTIIYIGIQRRQGERKKDQPKT